MDTIDPDTSSQHPPAHLGNILRSDLPHAQIIILDRFEQVPQLLRNNGLAEVGASLEGGKGLDGHDAGYDGDVDSGCSNFATPLDEDCGEQGKVSTGYGKAQ